MIKEKIEKFTASQEIGLDKIKAFLAVKIDKKDLSTRVFVLQGKAGTGKTTIIKYALKQLIDQDINKIDKDSYLGSMFSTPNVIGVTQSHKAKNILSNSIHVCKTFASTFGLEQKYNDDGSISFERPKYRKPGAIYPCEENVKVFVHDECSMYDKEMLEHVLKDTNSYSKIIFMGDPGQIPPVKCIGDEDSPTFSLDLKESNFHTLTERTRQTDGNPIIALSDIIYEQIFGQQNLSLVIDAMNVEKEKDGVGIIHVKRSDFLDHFKNISKDYQDTKVIAYKNQTVDNYNKFIRKHIHNNPDQEFIKGEIIYMKETYMNETDPKKKYVCYNSDEYIIDGIGKETIEGLVTDTLIINKGNHKHLFSINRPSIPVVNPISRSEYTKKLSTLIFWAKKAFGKDAGFKWKNYYDYKGLWGNVSYGYCYTGHKIQGSGYKNIYVDINDILTLGVITPKRKLQSLYTAITRAEKLVILIKKD